MLLLTFKQEFAFVLVTTKEGKLWCTGLRSFQDQMKLPINIGPCMFNPLLPSADVPLTGSSSSTLREPSL